jgi:hypothetical protein
MTTIAIAASDTEPGVILITIAEGDASATFRLEGQAAWDFAKQYALAYTQAFGDLAGAAGVGKAVGAFIAATEAQLTGARQPEP